MGSCRGCGAPDDQSCHASCPEVQRHHGLRADRRREAYDRLRTYIQALQMGVLNINEVAEAITAGMLDSLDAPAAPVPMGGRAIRLRE